MEFLQSKMCYYKDYGEISLGKGFSKKENFTIVLSQETDVLVITKPFQEAY